MFSTLKRRISDHDEPGEVQLSLKRKVSLRARTYWEVNGQWGEGINLLALRNSVFFPSALHLLH